MKEESTQNKIKDTALSLFARKGFEGTSLSDIASGVGIKKPSLYAHFKNKEDLFLGVIYKVTVDYNEFFANEAERLNGESPENQLYYLLVKNTEYLRNDELGLIFKRMMLFPPESLREEIYQMFEKTEEVMKSVIKSILMQMDRHKDWEQVFDAYLCLLDGVFEQVFYYSPEEHQKRLENSWSLFINGVHCRTEGK
ncbi:TetR/AcrR family transcriptional regulator [Guptibacillus hwajinpoensis]|uniref:AcrR family transcriptional regulator n=1 Tax=Guptibacillus hwajinpoensis TaxID=208199 RepID=A0ABU0K8N6_9BACL|nr:MULTISPECIES: TetR/AcrR family transcriptional regulator [Alkalihalobacillus]MDQ0484467.1 AcrR family transcriptional regulator [Alkalihalobacillus hemicentroti]